MKIHIRQEQGVIVPVVLFVGAIIGVVLAAYLSLVSAQNRSVARSQTWNSCIPVLEGGIEEALTHLYETKGTNLISNGWYPYSSGCFKWRSIGDGTALVIISNGVTPVIYSTAYVRSPLANDLIHRTVRVETRRDGLFAKGLVAKGQITLNGNNIVVDSFDSADPNYSSNGVYVASKRKDNGDVATNLGVVNSLSSGNANIYGHASTGPGGSVQIGPNGAIGNLAWQTSGTNGIMPGYATDDMNVSFPEVKVPFSGGFTPGNESGYQYVISSSGDYRIDSLTGSLLVRSNATARLVVEDSINLTGSNDKVIIEPGGSLQLYMLGTTAKISGQGVINNGGNATNFFYWGTSANTSLTVNGNGSFSGVIYAPNADFTMNGGGASSLEDVMGASVTGSVKMNGNFNFHYDENLGRLDLNRGFIVMSWNEL